MTSIIKLDANDHPIKSVTIFKSNKAEVVRTFEVPLEEGQSNIQIRHLSGSIDTESVCVTGLGDAQLLDVVCSIGPVIQEFDTPYTVEQLRRLHARKDGLIKELDAIDDISKTMMDYSKCLARDSIPPEQAEIFFEKLLTRSRDKLSTRASLEEDIFQLSYQIDALTSYEAKKQGKANAEITVVVMTKKATNTKLKLTYLVEKVTWSAAYELHATTEAGIPTSSISLHYRALLTQSTGEDWTGVEIALSTINTDPTNQTIPVLSSTKIRPPADAEPQLPLPQPHPLLREAIKVSTYPTLKVRASVPPPALRSGAVHRFHGVGRTNDQQCVETEVGDVEELTTALGEPTSVVHESPFPLTYHVNGASDVPSDGLPHQVSIARLPLEANIFHVAVPKMQPVAYIEASVKNTSDYRLLPGTVRAFVDDSFASKAAIVQDVAPGDVFSCTLGADPATRIRYACASKRADNSVVRRELDPCAALAYRSRTTVLNCHPFALRGFVVRDNVPMSEDEKRASVVLRRPEGLMRLEQGEELKVSEGGRKNRTVRWSKVVDGKGGKKEGMFEWVADAEAGGQVTIETEWDVKTSS